MPDYKSLEYPRHVHYPSVPGDWKFKEVKNAKEAEDAVNAGASLVPVIIGQPVVEAPKPGVVEMVSDAAHKGLGSISHGFDSLSKGFDHHDKPAEKVPDHPVKPGPKPSTK